MTQKHVSRILLTVDVAVAVEAGSQLVHFFSSVTHQQVSTFSIYLDIQKTSQLV